MNVLYIGGTGEISYECVHAGARLGHRVTVFNRGRSDEPLPAEVTQVRGELNDAAYRSLGDRHFDAVCQFLAYTPAQIEEDLRIFGGRCAQYVFISTASAYQKPPADHRINERTPLANPFWPYSQTKADMEATLMRWHEAGRLPVTIVRPSHTYRRRFPSTFIAGDDHAWRMQNGRPVIIHGDGTSLWAYTHAADFAAAFVRLLGNRRALGEAFHIARPDSTTWNQIFETIARVLDVSPRLVYAPTATLVRYNKKWEGPLWGDKSWSVSFDPTKLVEAIGPVDYTISMEDGLRRVLPYYRNRAATFIADAELHKLCDRIAQEQSALGSI